MRLRVPRCDFKQGFGLMNILCVGDVVGNIGCGHLNKVLKTVKKQKNIDFTIVNGENSSDGNGITPSSAQQIFQAGADVITTGNHSYRRREMYDFYDENEFVLRPANFPDSAPGRGMGIYDMGKFSIAVINLLGVVYSEPLDCPFKTVQRLIEWARREAKIIILDFHAEATAEKLALAFMLDGDVSAVFGTHTHVQTADERILPNGTGYITDVGMTGPINSVLGVKPELAIAKMRDKLPVRFETAQGECEMNGVIFEIDEKSGKCISAERIKI